MEQLAAVNDRDRARWNDVRRLIVRSLTQDPSNTCGFLAQYQSFVREGRTPPVEVVNGLGEALSLAPEANDIRIAYAYALANERMFDDALRLVNFLASDPHNGGMGRRVVDDLNQYRLQASMPQN